MGIVEVLVALHPRVWRDRYGEEFAVLLDDLEVTPRIVVDVVLHAAQVRARAHAVGLTLIAAVAISVLCHSVALLSGLSANILWAPTTPARALLLAGAVLPVVAVLAWPRYWRRTPGGASAAWPGRV